MFDLQKQDFSKAAEAGYTFELKLPTGAGSGAKLTILGDMSSTVKAYSRRKFQEYQQKQSIAKRKGKDLDDMDLDEAEQLGVESTLVRLVGWEGITEDGKEVPFSKDKASEVLTAHSWIRDAIMQESSDVTNFTPKTSKS
jgi:hypothetical protein